MAKPCVPPVTRLRGFKKRLKFNDANNNEISRIEYFFISHLLVLLCFLIKLIF